MSNKKPSYFIFRYASNRGTDRRICVSLPYDVSDTQALKLAKDWAEKSTCGTACYEYTVTIQKVQMLDKEQWKLKWESVCSKKRVLDDEYSNLRAMSMPFNWENV